MITSGCMHEFIDASGKAAIINMDEITNVDEHAFVSKHSTPDKPTNVIGCKITLKNKVVYEVADETVDSFMSKFLAPWQDALRNRNKA